MRKFSPIVLIFSLVFASISYAENDTTFRNLQSALGTLQAGYFNNKLLSEIPVNESFRTEVWYPSKLGVFQKHEKVKIMKLSHDKWKIFNPKTMGAVEFTVTYENNKIKVVKINSTPPTKEPDIQPIDVTSVQREKPNYVAFKGGVYTPTDDLEDFDNGFYGEISINSYFSEYFAFEIGVGYFETEYNESGTAFGYAYSGKIDIYSIPIITNLKGIVPFKYGELFLGAGLSAYYVYGDLDGDVPSLISISASDDDFIFGAQLLGGLNINITDGAFIGLEGKYIFTQDAELKKNIAGIPFEVEFNLNGYIVTGVIGFRF